MDAVDREDDFGVVERSGSHFLTRDADGWALWGVDQDDDEPLLTFPPDDAGYERALAAFRNRSRETRRVRVLAGSALVSGVVLVVIQGAAALYEHLARTDPTQDPFGGLIDLGPNWNVVAVLSSASVVAGALFQVSVGLFVITWLQRRWRREG